MGAAFSLSRGYIVHELHAITDRRTLVIRPRASATGRRPIANLQGFEACLWGHAATAQRGLRGVRCDEDAYRRFAAKSVRKPRRARVQAPGRRQKNARSPAEARTRASRVFEWSSTRAFCSHDAPVSGGLRGRPASTRECRGRAAQNRSRTSRGDLASSPEKGVSDSPLAVIWVSPEANHGRAAA
ncbi:hypothetical protein VTO73DRAFT_15192 [Trametes versicolor]